MVSDSPSNTQSAVLHFPSRRKSSDPFIVAITGNKRHGKDTFANRLINTWGFEKVAFADALKDACAAAFGIDRSDFDDDVKKEAPSDVYPDWTLRKILQVTGTELFRSQWPNIWVDTWTRRVADKKLVVLTDLRFPNEEMALRLFPYQCLLRIRNDRLPMSGDTHSSEAFIDSLFPDLVYTNNGSINELWDKADDFVKAWAPRYNGGMVLPRINRNGILR